MDRLALESETTEQRAQADRRRHEGGDDRGISPALASIGTPRTRTSAHVRKATSAEPRRRAPFR
jgi:tRNA(Ile2) C34 agmatinyltransferase TiaS